jgi:hypothetical protein
MYRRVGGSDNGLSQVSTTPTVILDFCSRITAATDCAKTPHIFVFTNLQSSQSKQSSMALHVPSLMAGSFLSGSVFLLVHQQVSYRNRLTYKWPLAGEFGKMCRPLVSFLMYTDIFCCCGLPMELEYIEAIVREQWKDLKGPSKQQVRRRLWELTEWIGRDGVLFFLYSPLCCRLTIFAFIGCPNANSVVVIRME